MIPIKLELTNFLSYRQPTTLDFHGIHLACVTGANGAGKSSILDAITWSLFGQSRSKSDDDLVNRLAARNDEAAEVKYTFELGGCTYRVVRRKTAGKTTILEFQMAMEDGKWKTLSESKVRETQAAIESLLNMNFDTFINASFLLQGKADEFTTKTPNKRKEILADLLGVNEWDRYREAAAARRKESEVRQDVIDLQLADIDLELEKESERAAALANAQESLEGLSRQLAVQEKLLEEMRLREEAIKQQKQQVKHLGETLNRLTQSLESLQKRQTQLQQERQQHQALLDRAETITAEYAAWQTAVEILQTWQEKADAYNRLQQEQRPHQLTLKEEQTRLTERKSNLEKRAKDVAAMEEEKSAVQESLKTAQTRSEEIAIQLKEYEKHDLALQAARSQLQALQGERQLLEQELGQLQKEQTRIERLESEKVTVQKNKDEAAKEYEAITAELTAAVEANNRLMVVQAELDNCRAEQPRLREQMDKIKDRLDRLQEESGSECPLCGQPLSETHRQNVTAELQQEGKEKGNRYRENQEKIQALTAEIPPLEKQIKQKTALERNQQAQQQRGATAEARLAEIDRAMEEWKQDGADRLAELTAKEADDSALIVQTKAVNELIEQLKGKAPLVEEQQGLQRQISNNEARLAEIERTVSDWETNGVAELAEVQERLEKNEIAPEAQAALTALDKEIATLGYDSAAHQEARLKRDELTPAQEQHQQLQQAQAAVKPLEDNLADLSLRITEQQQSVQETAQQHQDALTHLETISAGDVNRVDVEKEVFRLREDEIQAHRRVATAQQNVAVLGDLRKQKKQIVAERGEVTLHIQRLRLLEKACSREGVQALLIERALPEIEDDANELLVRLTGGQMQVHFETQRKLKSSDRLAETLDISISDTNGERPYENFSGGEQFRVNFAIRLALSRILARRSGARLQTLVIDEGFGSQDANGRQRLVEAINTIQDNFERILVITHIDELQDAFPVRIEVEKGINGSTIQVN
ncbi:MAG: SMC family ATPase [Candidatus Promineifilaceae bacterium]